MNDVRVWGPIVGALLALACLWASLRLRRRHRLFSDMPTSKVRGVFIGLVELKGTAESETPFVSHLAGAPCVLYHWRVEERWSRTVQTKKGTRRQSGWKTVAEGGETAPFYLVDDTGAVLVRPSGADLEPAAIFSETVRRSDDLYYRKGPPEAVSNSDHVRRFVEYAIPLHALLYVVGPARERADIVAPEVAAQKEAEVFLISTRTEDHVRSGLAGWSWFWWATGLLITSIPLIAVLVEHHQTGQWSAAPGPTFVPPAIYLAVWAACWVWMVYNSLVSLRERVRQGWSLIDVQLKRRHDLIPNLAAAVSVLGAHERETQEAVSALRTQAIATPPGVSGPDFEGLAGQLAVVIENYPQLTAQPAFASLHRELVVTEQRIALARAYYNDIAAQFATRLEIIPDRWVARLGSMRPEPLLNAAQFERAPVTVHFAS